MKKLLLAAVSGALFGFGLVLSSTTQPAKVRGILNIGGLWDATRFGEWDGSLALVMGAALCVALPAFAVTLRAGHKPWRADTFQLPTRRDIDVRLVIGAALFGVGWGLVGYCPGPALASLLTGGQDVAVFVAALLAGMWAARKFFA